MYWKIIDSGKKSAQKNMALDLQMLIALEKEPEALLHLYDWENSSATFGHFIDPQKFFKIQKVDEKKVDLAKRPTGGGIVFHMADFAFSLLVPENHPSFSLNPLDNYLFINEKVGDILKQFMNLDVKLLPEEEKERGNFCMAKPTKYDLMVHGKKVGGAAQRKTRFGYLHQGSILLGHLPSSFLEEILEDHSVIDKMHANSYPLLGQSWSEKDLKSARTRLKELFKEKFI